MHNEAVVVFLSDEEIEDAASVGRLDKNDVKRGAKTNIVQLLGMKKLKDAGAPIVDSLLVPRHSRGRVGSLRDDRANGYVFIWRSA